jgi:LytS/YehU family sensor histidine kinase
VGLANVRDRLAALYGTQGRLVLESTLPSGVRARLAIPCRGSVDAGAPDAHEYSSRAAQAPLH